jgi:hypothetical protein
MSRTVSPRARADEAERAVARLVEISQDLRGCAVLGARGESLASTGEGDWRGPATALMEAADSAGGEPVDQVHVATEDGEVFGVRHGDLVMVAVADRFTLASLMAFDMRTLLRRLAGD